MVNSCIVFGCTNREGRDGYKMFVVPRVRKNRGPHIEQLTRRRQQVWLRAINRKHMHEDKINASHRVCSIHFSSGSPASFMDEGNPDWAPHLNLVMGEADQTKMNYSRLHRRSRKKEEMAKAATALMNLSSNLFNVNATVSDIKQEAVSDSESSARETATQTELTGYQMDAERQAIQAMLVELTSIRQNYAKTTFGIHQKYAQIAFDKTKFQENDEGVVNS